MEPRITDINHAPGALRAMKSLETYLNDCGLEPSLQHLVRLRASQMNGCAYCIDMHWKDLRALGETEQRLYGLDAWRESPYYTDRERAALAWTEAVTRIAETHAPDEVYESVRVHFDDKEIVDLTWLLASINSWNRIAISFRAEPGKYQPAAVHAHAHAE
jgi:AhpD family alkylhydroperoxidase